MFITFGNFQHVSGILTHWALKCKNPSKPRVYSKSNLQTVKGSLSNRTTKNILAEGLLQKIWHIVIHSQTECMNTFSKTEVEKLVHAALWNGVEKQNNTRHSTDHLLLPTGQVVYCIWVCWSYNAVHQLRGGIVFYLKNYFYIFVPTDKSIRSVTDSGQVCICLYIY